MAIEFIGIMHTQDSSEVIVPSGPTVQPDYVKQLALAHEAAGFDRVLVAQMSSMPDGFTVASEVLNATTKLGVLLAHRPGFIAPTIAARMYATIDAFHPGNRIAMHVISGGDDADQARDGDVSDKPTRYRRTDEFLDVVELEWSSSERFTYQGEFYQVTDGWSSVRPESGHLPIYFGGASDDALRVGGRHADVFAFWGEPLEGIRERISQVRDAAGAAGRRIDKFSVSLRPIVADTEEEAWKRAQEILEITQARVGSFLNTNGARYKSTAVGSQRLLDYADKGDVHDKRLWTALSKATGAAGNSTALVGSYEQVAESLIDYIGVGATTLLIRGYEPVADAANYGNLIRLVHDQVGDAADAPEVLAI
jgi:alkanesulfonate monooxygenase